MQVFEKNIAVKSSDLDDLNHVNNVRYVQWVQDAAKDHWHSVAKEKMYQNYVWVVTSHHIQYKSPAIAGDQILIKTYVIKSEGVISTRIVEMYNSHTNKMIVKAQTNWCLLNARTKRPIRIPPEIIEIFN
ncbi:acyl-CoA thioesterase [Abyssalbus ytuae]|uniref:Acyl-CoA thioesterase n=1 Tax=Abyssalbus ytuae TaxID=2926907 RepID=A0A9E6ZSA9_9FLAO|nr:acyl-CoA thioesterase [Abyssalbus ytuae]UOB16948.1 acyl-CoA thioesterase [Abyssalbus ytuae]